jgi:hypothetical protein
MKTRTRVHLSHRSAAGWTYLQIVSLADDIVCLV